MILGIIGIILSLAMLITLAYRGVPVIIAAPLSAIVALLFNGAPILAAYTEIFMPAMAGYIGSFFPVFLLGAVFGVLMTVTGFAKSIAQTVSAAIGVRGAILATVVTSALMTYGGISLFVVAFVMFPLARELFRVADIPKRLIPATIALGIFTFTMTALPGTPQIQNIIPGQFFGTSAFAAPGVGILGSLMMFGMGMAWLEWRRHSMMKAGEHFDSRLSRTGFDAANDAEVDADEATGGSGTARRATSPSGSGSGARAGSDADAHDGNAPIMTLDGDPIEDDRPADDPHAPALAPANRWLPFLPLLAVFAVNFGCTLLIFPAMNWDYLSEEVYGGIGLENRSAMWAVILGLSAAILLLTLMHLGKFRQIRSGFVDGVKGALLPIMSVASEVGYGAVVASVAAFAVIRDAMFQVPGNALVTSVVSTSATAAITGSSSGGMTIALNAFGEDLRVLAEQQGISMEAMHRLTAMASGGLDTLPHSGAVVTLLLVCGMTHRQSYKDLAMMTVVAPVITVAVLVALVSAVGSF